MKCQINADEPDGATATAPEQIPPGTLLKNVFVVMPFSPTATMPGPNDWTETYEDVFRPAIEAAGYSCSRAEVTRGSLIGSIIEELRTARIVLADITDKNANVFYELGVRHALSKRTIIATQNADHIPSDLRGFWTIIYGRSPRQVKTFSADLARVIADIEANPERADSPVGAALERDNFAVLAAVQHENAKKLTALLTELTGNIANLESSLPPGEISDQLYTPCLELLLQTFYVDLGPEPLRCAYECMYGLRRIMLKNGAVPQQRFEKTLGDLQVLLKYVMNARNSLVKGQFNEPPAISLLVWGMGAATLPDEGFASCVFASHTRRFDFLPSDSEIQTDTNPTSDRS